MFNIGQYFEKFLSIKNREVLFREVVQKVIKEKVGIDVKLEDVTIKAGVVSIQNLSQGARSVIFVKKQSLVEALNKDKLAYIVKDIR